MSTIQQPPVADRPPQMVYVPAEKNGFGLTSVIAGTVGAVVSLIPILAVPGMIAGLLGLGFGVANVQRLRHGKATNNWATIIGINLSLLAIGLAIAGMVIVQHGLDQITNDLNNAMSYGR